MLSTRTRNAIRQAADDVRATFLPLLQFDLIVVAVSALLFTPVLSWLFKRFVSSTGKNVLSDTEIASFLLSPLGISALVVMSVAFLALGIFSSAGFMQILYARTRNVQVQVLPTTVSTLLRLPRIAGLFAIIVCIVLALALPFLVAIFIFAVPLISEFDIYFYISTKPPEFWQAIAIAGGLVFVLVVIYIYFFIAWALALPVLLFRGWSPIDSLRESKRLVGGRRKQIAGILISWILAVVAISAGLGLVGSWLAGLLVSIQTGLAVTAALMGVLLLVNTVVGLIASFLALTSLNAILVRIYSNLAGAQEKHVIGAAETDGVLAKIRRLPKAAWWCAGVATLATIAGFTWSLLKEVDLDAEVLVIAHRGSSLAAPENTMAAVELAIQEDSDYIEIDVQETSDGMVVVIHDADLKRIAGVPRPIADVRFEETRNLDIGSWFDPAFSDERLPTLRQVLDAAKGLAGVNIELKYSRREVNLTRRVLDVVSAAGAEDRVEYMSLSYDGTQELRRLDPGATVGFLSNVSIGNLAVFVNVVVAWSGHAAFL